MTLELAEVVSGWPLGISLAAAVAARGLWAGRRRTAMNEALHELRRPLQALALVAPGESSADGSPLAGSVQLAATALERLEREINGDTAAPIRTPLFVQPLLEVAVERWKARAVLAGSAVTLRWLAGETMVDGDRCELAQALDNLLVNAIEHGGPEIVIEARVRRGRLRVAVVDRGPEPRSTPPGKRPTKLVSRFTGRRRRGHGLRVVRRTAVAHGGSFHLHRAGGATEAVLELPLLGEVELGR